MATKHSALDKKLAESPEMNKFYRALTILSSNAVFRVMRQLGSNGKIDRADFETRRLIAAANSGGNHKCPHGQIWDEFAKRCIPLE